MSLTHLTRGAPMAGLATDVRAGLTAATMTLPPKYFYDAVGSDLFDQITRLEEYYLTRTERAILQARAQEIAALTRAETLVEIGSGTSEKTRILLAALIKAGTLRRFMPFDVDPGVLVEAMAAIEAEFPTIRVDAVVGDFEHHLPHLPRHRRRLVAFLGSTIGNLEPAQRADFLASLRATLEPGDAFLLGTDLVKAPARLLAAYNDARGVSAAFNKNVLSVLNRELGADFDLTAFDHLARWNAEREWMEMVLKSTRDQRVRIRAIDLELSFSPGEEIRTEISAKFRRTGVAAELCRAGLSLQQWWTDPAGDFALSLSVPT